MGRISNITRRGLLALLGGYAVAAIWATALARWLPGARIDATVSAAMMSFLIYTGVAIWAFAARRFGRACLTLLVIGVAGLLLAMVPR